MKGRKILGVILFALLGAGVFWGYMNTTSQSPLPTAIPADSAKEAVAGRLSGTDEMTGENESIVSTQSQAGTGSPDSVVILMADRVTTLEPYQMIGTHPDASVAIHLWDTLTRLNDDLKVEPHLAESWRVVNNFTWEFDLRQNITFHNGEPVNAEAVRFSIERSRSLPGSLETFAADVDLKAVEIVDDFTIRLLTSQPVANMPYHLAFLEILPPGYYNSTNPAQLAVAPIGSGPYQLREATGGSRIVLEAATDYWQGRPFWPRLIFQTAPLVEDRLAALVHGEVALVTDLPPLLPEEWNVPASRLEAIESTQRLFVGIHIQPDSPLADQQVRQALNHAVNVEQIVGEQLAGYGKRYGSWVNPPGSNPSLIPWPYDPDRARELLAEAGYSEGFTTTLATPVGLYYQDVAIAQAIAQQLREIGVNATIEKFEWPLYLRQLLSDHKPPLFLLGLNSYGDGLEDTKNMSVNFSFNPTGWQNDLFEDLLKGAINTFDDTGRMRRLNEAQAIAYEAAPWIWLWRQYEFYGLNEKLDWTPRRDGLINLYKPVESPAQPAE